MTTTQYTSVQPYEGEEDERNLNIPNMTIHIDGISYRMTNSVVYSFERIPSNMPFASLVLREENNVEDWPVSSEFLNLMNDICFEFCNTHGLIPTLRICVNKIKEIFTEISDIHIDLDHFEDDETPDEGHVVFRVSTKSDTQTTMKNYDNWIDWIVDTIEEDKQSLITLTID